MFHSSRYSNPICLFPVQNLGQSRAWGWGPAVEGEVCGCAKNGQGAAPPLEGPGLAICLGKKKWLLWRGDPEWKRKELTKSGCEERHERV